MSREDVSGSQRKTLVYHSPALRFQDLQWITWRKHINKGIWRNWGGQELWERETEPEKVCEFIYSLFQASCSSWATCRQGRGEGELAWLNRLIMSVENLSCLISLDTVTQYWILSTRPVPPFPSSMLRAYPKKVWLLKHYIVLYLQIKKK